jgi:hypothetical protein
MVSDNEEETTPKSETADLVAKPETRSKLSTADAVAKEETEDDADKSDTEEVADKSDYDSDFDAPGSGRRKRKAKSKAAASNKRRSKSAASSTPKSNKCRQCRQRLDDNPNLVINNDKLRVALKVYQHLSYEQLAGGDANGILPFETGGGFHKAI